MFCKQPARVLLTTLFLSFPVQSSAQTTILSADVNMISALDPILTSYSVSDLAVRPTGMEQFLVNILQGGTQVFIDQYFGHGNRGVAGAYEQLYNYYNSLPGITATMPGVNFTSSDLAGKDLLITSVPNVAYTADELQAMSDLLSNDGTIFFLGGEGQNFTGSTVFINDALSFLGSGLELVDDFIAYPGWPFYTSSVNTTHPLMAGVPNLSVAVSGSVSGGEFLAFYIQSGVEYAVLATEGGGGGSDSDGDGVPDDQDICPGGDDTVDSDGDGTPDFCDACPADFFNDSDGDGSCDSDDICLGDDLTGDSDSDGLCDDSDPCIGSSNSDTDGDGVCDEGDLCLGDDASGNDDGDGVCNDLDVCEGDDASGDTDGDAFCDDFDVCPVDVENDGDGDGICEVDDNCDIVPNQNQSDLDGDGVGDLCDSDIDGDGTPNDADNCVFDVNPSQADFDNDGEGDVCDNDVDGDGVVDAGDACIPTPVGEVVNTDGCSIAELCPCENNWKNHGAYVRCVAHASEDFVDAGLISEAEKDAIVSAAGQSQCGHRN